MFKHRISTHPVRNATTTRVGRYSNHPQVQPLAPRTLFSIFRDVMLDVVLSFNLGNGCEHRVPVPVTMREERVETGRVGRSIVFVEECSDDFSCRSC